MLVTKYQVQSKFVNGKWLDDHMPFDTEEEAKVYISTQPQSNYSYRIIKDEWEEPEPGTQEFFELHDCWDAIGGDWQG